MKNIIILFLLALFIKSFLSLFQNIYFIINISYSLLVSKLKNFKFSVTYKEEEEIQCHKSNLQGKAVNNSTSGASGGNSQFKQILGILSSVKFYLIWSFFIYYLVLFATFFIAYKYYCFQLSDYLMNLELEFAKNIINNMNCSRYYVKVEDLLRNHQVLSNQLYITHDITHFKDYIHSVNNSVICLKNLMQPSPDLSSKVTALILQDMIAQHTTNITELPQTIAHTTILASIPLVSAITLIGLISILELAGTMVAS